MKIIECYIENFGKISGKNFDFTSGFNTVIGENGYGKTTLSVFIKCMFYGMNDTKKLSLDENERKKYLPWSGAAASGSLVFSTDKKRYRIERSFAPKASDDRFMLYDVELGRESTDYTSNLGEELFGVDAESFERTLFLSERNLSPKNDNKSISAKLSELVGCDGDISSMDGALKLLEDQRKAYAKKGGSGEIADLKYEISRLEEELSEIDKCEARMKATEEQLARLVVRERELREEDRGIIRERETVAQRASDMNYKNTITDMRTRLSINEAKRDELIKFFNGEIPSVASIDRAKMAESEANRLRGVINEKESAEYLEHKSYFEGKVTADRIEDIKDSFERVKRGVYEESPLARRKKELFTKRTPTLVEVEAQIASLGAGRKKSNSAAFLLSGAALAVASIILAISVSALLALLLVPALALVIAPFIIKSSAKKKQAKALSDFFASISDSLLLDTRAPLDILHEIRALLSSNEASGDGLGESDKAELKHFAFMFGKGGNIYADVAEILEKYEKYKELAAIERYKAQNRSIAEAQLKVIESELAEFLSHYNCKTEDPIEELRTSLVEYTRLSDDIVAKRKDITNLSSNRNTTEEYGELRTTAELDKRGSELSFLLTDINRERALLDRQYRADGDRLDTREEILSRKGELEDKLEAYTNNLEIIKLTKKYLEDARESMTTKYLGKTKSGFEKYTKRISGEDGSFEMDTNFGVSKLEGAKTHVTEAYSRGTRDLYNLAARFALIDSLYEGEEPFVILDDPFTSFDDEKCAAALSMLREYSKEKQVIYFTCSKSRS